MDTHSLGPLIELLVLSVREDNGGRVVLAMFHHTAAGLGMTSRATCPGRSIVDSESPTKQAGVR